MPVRNRAIAIKRSFRTEHDNPILWEISNAAYMINIGLANNQQIQQNGCKGKAIEHYEKFLDLWKDADPGITKIKDAKKRLAGLKRQ